METPNNQEQSETSIPKIVSKKFLLDIFIHNTEDNKEKVDLLLSKIQKQIDPYKNAVSAMFYMDKGEKTPEEKEQWFLENGNSKFYIVVDTLTVKPDFIKQAVVRLKNYHAALDGMKNYGIKLFKPPAQKIQLSVVKN